MNSKLSLGETLKKDGRRIFYNFYIIRESSGSPEENWE
jgi:hypothetical protein